MSEDAVITRTIAKSDDVSTVVDILSSAFADDPFLNWVTSNPSYPRFAFDLTVPNLILANETYLTSDKQGASVWTTPDFSEAAPTSYKSILEGLMHYGFKSCYRAIHCFNVLGKHHPKYPHYYLFAIGVNADMKHQGIGSQLMAPTLRDCDANNMPAYLENSNEANLDFYGKFGFKVSKELSPAKGCPPLWLMERPPQ